VEVRVNAEKNNPWSPMKINPGYIESKSPIKIEWMIHNETNKHLSSYIRKFRFINRFVGFLNGFCGSKIEREISFVNEGFNTQEIDFTTTGPITIQDISFYDPDSSVTSGVITLCLTLPDKPIGFTYYLGAHDISNDNIWDRVIFSGESKPIFQLQPPFLYWDPVKDKLAPKSCTLTPLTREAISSVKIGENDLDYNTKIEKIDNKKWEIQAIPKSDGKNLTGKIEIWINKLSYPLSLRLIGK
jgi:hypothetical protein